LENFDSISTTTTQQYYETLYFFGGAAYVNDVYVVMSETWALDASNGIYARAPSGNYLIGFDHDSSVSLTFYFSGAVAQFAFSCAQAESSSDEITFSFFDENDIMVDADAGVTYDADAYGGELTGASWCFDTAFRKMVITGANYLVMDSFVATMYAIPETTGTTGTTASITTS